MKNKHPNQASKRSERRTKSRKEQGIAIVTVLSVLLLMTILVLSFFEMARTELAASKHYADGIKTRILKDSAVSLVISTLREGTTQRDSGTTNGFMAWASQPGALRTYNIQGRLDRIYKLYSSTDMIVDTAKDAMKLDLPSDWQTRVNQFVDLNSPVVTMDLASPNDIERANVEFPIADPRAFYGDEEGTTEGSIEGFTYSDELKIPGAGKTKMKGVVEPGGQASNMQRLPMPVTWLYVLEDGTFGHLNDSDNFVGSQTPTQENPIVGRIAYWTDDESCKINVNTASEGVFWDTPRCDTDEERLYGATQPANGEYQRYPGHPAMVCMSSVLYPNSRYRPSGFDSKSYNNATEMTGSMNITDMEKIWEIAPAIGTAVTGTYGGTKRPQFDTRKSLPVPAEPENWRLYTSPDEIVFQSKVGTNGLRTPTFDPDDTKDAKVIERIRRSQFMLTAKSRAPEVNLYGSPKICMWPMHETVKNRGISTKGSGFDELIAFNCTIGGQPYFLQRDNAFSRHNEFYGRAGGRNEALWEYAKAVTRSQIPGFGGTFAQKYGGGRFDDRDQIIAQFIDYIRSTNLNDGLLSVGNQYGNGKGQLAAFCMCGGTSPHADRWSNSRLPLPKGLGRIMTVSEVAFLIYVRAENSGGVSRGEPVGRLLPNHKQIQVAVLAEGFSTSHGWTGLIPKNSLKIDGKTGSSHGGSIPDITLNGEVLSWNKDPGSNTLNDQSTVTSSSRGPSEWYAWGGSAGVRWMGKPGKVIASLPVNVPVTSAGLIMQSNTSNRQPFRVILFDEANNWSTGNLIQSFQLDLPDGQLPMPSFSVGLKADIEDRFRDSQRGGVEKLYSQSDVIRSMVPAHSDYRIITGKRVITPELFKPHPDWNSRKKMAHSLTGPLGPLPGATYARGLIEGVEYGERARPDLPMAAFGEDRKDGGQRGESDPNITGDFDNGVGPAPDGAYANRPDDGDVRTIEGNEYPYFDSLETATRQGASAFSPNKVVAGPGSLGSLPTGVQDNVAWQTLLLRPQEGHYGQTPGLPKDHLLLDLFWMPVVEPYAISEPFSTAGKINLNYDIMPFRYIKRATALHALFKGEKMLAIPAAMGKVYKNNAGNQAWRHFINARTTLQQWEDKFDDGLGFISPSQICEMYLVPDIREMRGDFSIGKMETFWKKHALTGDNSRERPYANMYPRLTTRSNVFKVHMIAQTIQKVKGSDPTKFDNKRDKISGVYRGSAIIERSIDPADRDIGDYVRNLQLPSLDTFYTYRITNEKQFNP